MADHLEYQEAQLIQQLHQGSDAAFTTIYQQLHQRLYFYACRFVTTGDAEDITAECFVQLWRRRQEFGSLGGIAAYLHVMAKNRCLNLLRDEKYKAIRQKELLETLEASQQRDLAQEQVRVELVKLIYAQVDKLPERVKQVFLLSYQEGLKPGEIAERLGVSVQTVSNQKVSAIKLLKAALTGQSLLAVLYLLLQIGPRD